MLCQRKPHRGVLLLIVLSLLVLFVLIGITFIVVANQYTRAARAFSRHDLTGDPPAKELDGALMQLLRGTSDRNSLTHRHNLLRDLYGIDGFEGSVLSTTYGGPNGQQFLAMQFADAFGGARPSAHYYAGSIITLLDGQGAGHSARILRYQPPTLINGTRQGILFLESFEEMPPAYLPAPSTRFLVNGKPFNGTGDGFNLTTGKLDDQSIAPFQFRFESALMPLAQPNLAYGDSDESWDAADYQNLFLARIPGQIPQSGVPTSTDPLIPSFHRPYLINYWMHRLEAMGQNWAEPSFEALRRFVVARPMPDNHPFFTGGNPRFSGQFDDDGDGIPDVMDTDLDGDDALDTGGDGVVDTPLVRGPWDIDNDNDGVADSIWVDLGSPIKTSPDGRLYKPLFAILCVDVDGRLNINAHGTREVLAMADVNLGSLGDVLAAGPTNAVTMGQGYGPAEIRLDRIFTTVYPPDGLQRYARLLNQRYRPRYGAAENPPAPGWPDVNPFPGNNSFLSTIHLWGLPSNYVSPVAGEGNLYLNPPDLAGVGGVYLDWAGQPRFVLNQVGYPPMGTWYNLQMPSPFVNKQTNAAQDDPYEIDLVTRRGNDSAFGVEELEQLLRHNDLDMQTFATSLSQILIPPTPTGNPLPNNNPLSRRLTTHSFDIPTLNATIPDDDERQELAQQTIRAYQAGGTVPSPPYLSAGSLVELVLKRLREADPNRTDLDSQLRLILPPEVREGRRMDLNRLFGNGIDDNNNGVVDEPIEWAPGQIVWDGTPFAATSQYGDGDPNYDANNPYFSRQQFARHLFCLAMLAMDEGFEIPNVTAAQPRRLTARRLAQWAINVVDFRDRDAIMTPFEYDWDPYDDDGWNVDDDFTTRDGTPDRQVVWGCESPELLITESLAMHDRRVRDTNREIPNPAEGDAGTAALRFPREHDDDLPGNFVDFDASMDQYRIPQGSLFLELYATGNPVPNRPASNLELYNPGGTLDLDRLANDGNGDSPVWRIAIAKPPLDPDPNSWNPTAQALLAPALLNDPNPAVFRTIVNNDGLLAGAGTNGLPQAGIQYDRFIVFTSRRPATLRIPPGPYYYNYNSAQRSHQEPSLWPGQYAVIGPRAVTAMGSLNRRTASPPLTERDPSEASNQRIVLAPDNVYYYDFTPNPPVQGIRQINARPALTFIAATDPPATWTNNGLAAARFGIGVNVSEPNPTVSYYREPRWGPPNVNLDPGRRSHLMYEEPWSYYGDLTLGSRSLPDIPFDYPPQGAGSTPPLAELPNTMMTGTHTKFRVALLQRLADPTRSWHAVTNPYLTVDSQPIDLTVFNGEGRTDRTPVGWDDNMDNPAAAEPYDVVDDPTSNLNPDEFFYPRERGMRLPQAITTAGSLKGPNVWNPISQPLQPLGRTTPTNAQSYWGHRLGGVMGHSLGALNMTYGPRIPNPPQLMGAPTQPIPWLTWNNRPFVSQFELLMVPSSAPWRLPYEMRRVENAPTNLAARHVDFLAPWAHLLNFFYDDPSGPDPNLAVLLDWLEVPSRFVGTQTWLNPQLPYRQQMPELWSYGPPFNKISRFRDPGKININTIPDQFVWDAIDPQTSTPWSRVRQSLQGTGTIDNRPAFYASPVRAAASANLMPLDTLEQSAADASLLRRDPIQDGRLLFDFPSGNRVNDPRRHPYFQYHKLQRLANLLTTHSNVYAVWITVGHFEVYPWNATTPLLRQISWVDPTRVVPVPDAAHPDGYQLGPELGSGTGQVKRHRAFYVIDRSIPAAYKPGQDLNVDRIILLRRFIE